MIGPCVLDPGPDTIPDWLASIDRPIVLVTTSSEKQADADLVATAMSALADEPSACGRDHACRATRGT